MRHGDDLGDRRHADGVGAERAERADLRGRLVRRARQREVDPFLQRQPLRRRDLLRLRAQRLRIGLAHVGEANAELLDVRPAQRVHPHEVDVIGDQHQVAGLVRRVHAAGGVRDHERLDAEAPDDTREEHDLVHLVAFVEVHASLHDHDGQRGGVAEDHAAGVSEDRRGLGAGDLAVGNGGLDVDTVDDVAEPGAENETEARLERRSRADERHGFVNLLDHGGAVYEKC